MSIEEEKEQGKEIIRVLAKQMDTLTSLQHFMTTDECDANKGYKDIENAIYRISDAISIDEIEMEQLMAEGVKR